MQSEKRASQRRKLRIPISCWETDNGKPVGHGADLVCHDMSAEGLSFNAEHLYRIDSPLVAMITAARSGARSATTPGWNSSAGASVVSDMRGMLAAG